ncbi:DNA-binding response regulator [Pseudomonas protegens]|uniref:response regulator transcription factor n=1 Tax=Pseudomonas protegens TaxID=380021 RepID=UPI000F4D01F7|nr:response regulator transcription factor [Pseudomonas protegens]ROL62671.1 DNA-binding response regulator [Pseudomonas protegens]
MSRPLNRPIRIAVLDDHALIRMALQLHMEEVADLTVIGLYASSTELMSALRYTELDLLILDYQLGEGDLDGLRLIRLLRNKYPQLQILVSSATETPFFVKQIIDTGANGFLGKSQPLEDLVPAIRAVMSEGIYLSSLMAFEMGRVKLTSETPSSGLSQGGGSSLLSPKESEVLRCVLNGQRITQIASKFSRSIKTISGQKQAAFRKLGIRNDAELFKVQHKLGWEVACEVGLPSAEWGG